MKGTREGTRCRTGAGAPRKPPRRATRGHQVLGHNCWGTKIGTEKGTWCWGTKKGTRGSGRGRPAHQAMPGGASCASSGLNYERHHQEPLIHAAARSP